MKLNEPAFVCLCIINTDFGKALAFFLNFALRKIRIVRIGI